MTGTKSCGCTTETCGCCEGTQILTPMATENRPGLSALQYRVGTHGSFFETMKARLGTMCLDVPSADGTTYQTLLPLTGLTTRDPSDPAIALLDAWATVADVLTFYQERIANEGFLRTATERRSVLELARLVGYTLRPGVAASVFLAYLLDTNQTVPVDIPGGAQSQSIPGPGELPQFFETSDDLEAHADWNNLQVRLTQPQNITFETAFSLTQIYAGGTSTNVKPGDPLLFYFGGNVGVVRRISSVTPEFDTQRTVIAFQAVPQHTLDVLAALLTFIKAVQNSLESANPIANGVIEEAQTLVRQVYLGVAPSPAWAEDVFGRGAGRFADWKSAWDDLNAVLNPDKPSTPGGGGQTVVFTDPHSL